MESFLSDQTTFVFGFILQNFFKSNFVVKKISIQNFREFNTIMTKLGVLISRILFNKYISINIRQEIMFYSYLERKKSIIASNSL